MRSKDFTFENGGEVGLAVLSRTPYVGKFLAVLLLLITSDLMAGEDAGLRILKLNSMLSNFAIIRQSLLVRNEGRVSVMEDAVKQLKTSIEEDDFGATSTIHWQQMFFASFKVSQSFFE